MHRRGITLLTFLGVGFITAVSISAQSAEFIFSPDLLMSISGSICASSEIKGRKSSVEIAKENIAVQKAEYFPKLQLESNYLHLDRKTTYTEFDFSERETGTSSKVSLSTSLTIYDRGLTSAKIRAAELSFAAEQESVIATSQELMIKVVDLYYKKKGADNYLEVSRESGEHSSKLIRLANYRLRGGIGNAVDLALAQARDARVRLEIVQAESAANDAEISLANYIRKFSNRDCAAYQGALVQSNKFLNIPTYEEAIERLQQESARLKELRQRIDFASANIEVARRTNGPVVKTVLNQSLDQNSKDDSTFGRQYSSWYAGIAFSFPIFSGFSTDKQTKVAIAEKSKSQDAFDEEWMQEIGAVRTLYGQINGAQKELTAYLTLLKANEVAVNKSLGRFQFGMGSISDALLAQTELIETKKSYRSAINKLENLQARLLTIIFGGSLIQTILE